MNVTNIPTGPSNVVQRLLAFTATGGATFYHVPATMTINDNTTTSLTVDFTDTILLSGTSMDYLFSQIELPEQLGVTATPSGFSGGASARIWTTGSNLTFDGGWDASRRWTTARLARSIRRSARAEPRADASRVGRRVIASPPTA